MNKIHPRLNQSGIVEEIFWLHSVQLGVSSHPDVEVGVRDPVHGLLEVRDCAKYHFRIQLVREGRNHLALDWQLLVVEREVVLQI